VARAEAGDDLGQCRHDQSGDLGVNAGERVRDREPLDRSGGLLQVLHRRDDRRGPEIGNTVLTLTTPNLTGAYKGHCGPFRSHEVV